MTPRLWLLSLILSPLIALFWKRVRTAIFGSRRVIPTGSQSVFAVVRNRTVEILLGDGARASHKGQLGIRLKRLAYVYLWRRMAAGMRVRNADAAAKIRRLRTVVKPSGIWETICRAFDRFCRESLQFTRNRWHGFRQSRRNFWRIIRLMYRTRRNERRPITEALAERRREDIAEEAGAILDRVPHWRLWLRRLPLVGSWFGSNRRQTDAERQTGERRENAKLYTAIGAIVLLASAVQFASNFGALSSILYAYVTLLSVRLISAGRDSYVGSRALSIILWGKASTVFGVIAMLVWYHT